MEIINSNSIQYDTLKKGLDSYINQMKENIRTSEASAKKEARLALRRTGVTTLKGTTKKQIVSWK